LALPVALLQSALPTSQTDSGPEQRGGLLERLMVREGAVVPTPLAEPLGSRLLYSVWHSEALLPDRSRAELICFCERGEGQILCERLLVRSS
jgi:hypothetical protein